MGTRGFEPRTPALSTQCSNQLSYAPKLLKNILFTRNTFKRVMRIELTTSAWKAEVLPLNYTRKWRETESNRRHMELQSIALPTELPSQKCNL